MRLRKTLVTALALALTLVAAPSPADTSRVRATDSRQWRPGFRHIVKGDRIVWKNPTSTSHTVTAYQGPWSKNTTVSPGGRTSRKFRRRGTYLYRCMTPGHSSLTGGECNGMCGEIHVTRR